MDEDLINKKVKISLKNGMFYNGVVISQGDKYIRIRDIKNSIVFINLDIINVLEELA